MCTCIICVRFDLRLPVAPVFLDDVSTRMSRHGARRAQFGSFRACRMFSRIHLLFGEDALDVNPTVRLHGAVAAVHGAYPRFRGLDGARQ